MQSFHNDVAVKQKYLDRVLAHQKEDNIIRGRGWSNGKGCAVGCTLENYDHSRYPIELGIPEWLARVEDRLFEGMSLEKSKTWPYDFLKAIPLDITERQFELQVKAPFLVLVLESALTTFAHAKFPDVKTAIDGSIALWKRDDISSEDWNKAAGAATWSAHAAAEAAAEAATWSATWSARSAEAAAGAATWSATWSAAEAATWSATWPATWSAAHAATWSAAEAAAEAATWSATWSAGAAGAAKYDYFADELLRLLSALQPAASEKL
jgi:hypothetical protein